MVKTLLTQQVCLGVRLASGPNRGQIECPAAMSTVSKMLKHPIYAGIYVFGRTQSDPRRRGKDGCKGPGRVAVEPGRYHAYLPGQCPAYINAEQYEANQRKLTANRARTDASRAVREGPSLLAGLVRCGRCQRRMQVAYACSGGSRGKLRYTCINRSSAQKGCRHQFLGEALDQAVSNEGPAGVGSRGRGTECRGHGGSAPGACRDWSRHWRQRLERRATLGRAIERQYQLVEPENRLVGADTRAAGGTKPSGHTANSKRSTVGSNRHNQKFLRRPSSNNSGPSRPICPGALWHAPTTHPSDRQQIIRIVVQEVLATTEGTSDRLTLRIMGRGHVSPSIRPAGAAATSSWSTSLNW